MTERPIIMSAPMVRAILEGRKTQTRRIMKSQPYTLRTEGFGYPTKAGGFVSLQSEHCLDECPKGVPGDRLWVKETTIIAPKFWNDGTDANCVDVDGVKRLVQYLATSPNRDAANAYKLNLTASIYMPRWASRIALEITEVRVQRLQEISNEDCIAEGITIPPQFTGRGFDGYPIESEHCDKDPSWFYSKLWDSIHGPGSWAQNPWVWAVNFTRMENQC